MLQSRFLEIKLFLNFIFTVSPPALNDFLITHCSISQNNSDKKALFRLPKIPGFGEFRVDKAF